MKVVLDDKGIKGIDRFLRRAYSLVLSSKENIKLSNDDEHKCNHTINYITKNMTGEI